ncbi:nuclear transport factor 2 family protein [Aliamphritea spongicola]|uniref:nuclear transport factor 2 family protein n=1 Tax=Aliamphritea spongicola TaxID=707589 RepID=UPI00196A766B|nr:nuclear transport factor 2 family protein [Aliamphritea spongicola]MBN3563199.1 nuclear transport factor 2 family protein [Aliamphritea spongicola]
MKTSTDTVSLTQALYQAVDRKDVDFLAQVLGEAVYFQLGNFPAVEGLGAVLEANRGFFSSIESMSHTLDNIWQEANHTICHGKVDYVRLDKTHHSARFATVLRWQEGVIDDYRVYADISGL